MMASRDRDIVNQTSLIVEYAGLPAIELDIVFVTHGRSVNVKPKALRFAVPSFVLLTSVVVARAQQQAAPPIAFTVSMDPPAAHLYHITMEVEGLSGEAQDFKMPVWTPGYYGL